MVDISHRHVVAIIQARMGSSRLPGKVLMPLGNKPVLAWLNDAAKAMPYVDQVIVATSTETGDDKISEWCEANEIDCFRGNEQDVLLRFYDAAKTHNATHILRLTGDCPLIDPDVCGAVVYRLLHSDADYVSNTTLAPAWPDGMDCEAMTFSALEKVHQQAKTQAEREHVTRYIYTHRHQFKCLNLPCPIPGLHQERWTLDMQEDYALLQKLTGQLDNTTPPRYLEVLDVLEEHPQWRDINSFHIRNSWQSSIDTEIKNYDNFATSTALLERTEVTIPLGSQTFSKSKTQWPVSAAPLFATHGYGGKIWDADGQDYVDLVSALLPNLLGYLDPDVDQAIRDQMTQGISFSLATELEAELAEELVKLIPCAEMARFGKNGSDVTSAAIRLARAHTGRDHIINCGYHGWHDWHIGSTTMHLGIPEATSSLTHPVPYNDIEAVETLIKEYPGQIAAMIMEPMNVVEPKEGYFSELHALLQKHNILLIFDEIITGFRFAKGGAQELFGVTPDLATFGKAMANGMPLSALVGRKDIMKTLENIFFSGTFGGETLSLAASLAVMKKIQTEPVIKQLWEKGDWLRKKANAAIVKNNLQDVIHFMGKAPWHLLGFQSHNNISVNAIKTFFIHHMARHGVLTLGAHNICYAHNELDLQYVAGVYDHILPMLAEQLHDATLEKHLPCDVITPLFSVRNN